MHQAPPPAHTEENLLEDHQHKALLLYQVNCLSKDSGEVEATDLNVRGRVEV